jgi:hypothetical protein
MFMAGSKGTPCRVLSGDAVGDPGTSKSIRVLKYTLLNVDAETLKDSTFDVLHSTFRLRFSAACYLFRAG